MQIFNSSFEILKAQFGENPDGTLLTNNSDIMEDIREVLDEI